MANLTASAWLTLEPAYKNGEPAGFRITKLTQNRPSTDQPSMRVVLAIPAAAFTQFAPSATIELPDDFAFPEPIVTVEPTDV